MAQRELPSLGGGKLTELRQRIFFVLGALIIFRLGAYIPIPGVDPNAVAALFQQTQGSIVDVFNMFSGGALERMSVMALGVMPYISASIIMQMMSAVVPSLEQLKKEGEQGRRKITQYTRYGTVLLATFQALGISFAMQGQVAPDGAAVVITPGIAFSITTVITLVTGTMFLVWLGEQISERGIGNGISLLIFASIVSGLPSAIGGTLELARTGSFSPLFVLGLFVGVIVITGFVVFVERGQRRITVNYAKRQQGDVRRHQQPFAAQVEYGGRDSADFRVEHHSFSGQPGQLLRAGGRDDLVERPVPDLVARAADLRVDVRGHDHLLLLFLHCAGVQPAGDRG